MDLALLDSRLVIALVSTGLGAFLMFLIQMIVNKRGLFTDERHAEIRCWVNPIRLQLNPPSAARVRSLHEPTVEPGPTPQKELERCSEGDKKTDDGPERLQIFPANPRNP